MEKILTKEELKIINLFRMNLFEEYTIREVMRKLKKKSYNWVFIAVGRLKKLGLVNLRTKGKSSLCSINLESHLTLSYLSLLEKLNLPKGLPDKNINELINSLDVSYFSFIITGSYAEGKQTKKSDLDVLVIVENKQDVKRVFNVLNNKGELMIPKVHVYVFSKIEFLEMLLNKEENYGKLAFRESKVIFGAENYYLILKEAIRNGFTG